MIERRSVQGVDLLVSGDLLEAGFHAAFTERGGGVSEGPFGRLNLGFRYGDRVERVRENRGRVARALGVDAFACPELVHGTRIAPIGPRRAGAGFDRPEGHVRGADGLITRHAGLPIAVMAADCLMTVLADPRSGRVAAVHAGWRGLAGAVLSRAVARFDRPRDVLAAIGPAIGPDHYEVGPEVVEAVSAATERGAVVVRRRPRPHLDLPATAEHILREAGVLRVEQAGVCTFCEEGRFFSFRRDGRGGWQGLIARRL